MTGTLRQIGVITRPHGVRGEVKVRPETDDPERIAGLDEVRIGPAESDAVGYPVAGAYLQPLKTGVAVVLALDGIADREAAESLSGLLVFADEADLPPLAEDEVFLSDLVGLLVETDAGQPVGTVRDVLDLPAQPVLVVDRPNADEVMIPFVDAFVVSMESGRVIIRPVEGLLEADRQEVAR